MLARAAKSAALPLVVMAAVFGFAGLVSVLTSRPAVADWQGDLQRQLRQDYNCEVSFLSRLEVRRINGQEIVFARAHCTDQRSFDVNRNNEAEAFQVRACDVQAC